MSVTFSLRGVDAVDARLIAIGGSMRKQGAAALFAEAEIEMAEAKRRTPVDTGTLRASGFVEPPQMGFGKDITVTLGFGGAAAGYAVYVHEDLEAFHTVGQAKFLESTLLESAPFLAARIARRIDLSGLG